MVRLSWLSRRLARNRFVAFIALAVCSPIFSKVESSEDPQPFVKPADRAFEGGTQMVTPFSREWILDMLAAEKQGDCGRPLPVYAWRNVGWGSKINRLLRGWTSTIARGLTGIAVDVSPTFMTHITCSSAAEPVARFGWHCLFKPMRGICILERAEEEDMFLEDLLINVEEIPGVRQSTLSALGLDSADVAAALLEHVYSNMQSWFEDDIVSLLTEPTVMSVRSDNYIALHVRRGDKLRREAEKFEVQTYLEAAALYLGQPNGTCTGMDSISGIWVSSDDSTVLPEVQQLSSQYFPCVLAERVTSISFDFQEDGVHSRGDELPTTTNGMTYERFVGLHAELSMMAEADAFVGTFSSNMGRLVYLMRKIKERPRDSTINVEHEEWILQR